jgi:hypothetical protein
MKVDLKKVTQIDPSMRIYKGSTVCNLVPVIYMSEPLKTQLKVNLLHTRIWSGIKSVWNRLWKAVRSK